MMNKQIIPELEPILSTALRTGLNQLGMAHPLIQELIAEMRAAGYNEVMECTIWEFENELFNQ
jgi:hypothetical protein